MKMEPSGKLSMISPEAEQASSFEDIVTSDDRAQFNDLFNKQSLDIDT